MLMTFTRCWTTLAQPLPASNLAAFKDRKWYPARQRRRAPQPNRHKGSMSGYPKYNFR
jgi:hypothetical protein